jgi:uncharacterized protein DUF4236
MAYFRFHKSLGVPGFRINLSKSGPSLSVGRAGLRLNVGPQGIRTTVGLPGSGLSVINRKTWGSMSGPQSDSGDKIVEGDHAPDGITTRMDRAAGDPRQLAYDQYERERKVPWYLIKIMVAIMLGSLVVAGMINGAPLAWGIAAGVLALIVGNKLIRRFAS